MRFDCLNNNYRAIYMYDEYTNYTDHNLKIMYKYSVTLYNVTSMPEILNYLHQL